MINSNNPNTSLNLAQHDKQTVLERFKAFFSGQLSQANPNPLFCIEGDILLGMDALSQQGQLFQPIQRKEGYTDSENIAAPNSASHTHKNKF